MSTSTGQSDSASAPSEATFSATRGLCNTCGILTDAKVVFRGGKVYLVKWCQTHGRSEALISSDQEWYVKSLGYVKPGEVPLERAVAEHHGCPESCGLCPEHQQHTCVPIFEITQRCDLACPVCLVSAPGTGEVSLEEARGVIEGLLRAEGQVNMLTLSGGEPTAHPDFLAIVDAALRPEIGVVSVSTNGLRLSQDDALLEALAARGVVISLQFDGFRPETSRILRGRPELVDAKLRLLEKARAAGLRVSLTVTLAKGVNEDELSGILELLFKEDHIVSVMVQPVAYLGSGQELPHDPLDVLTVPDVVKLLATQSQGVLTEKDITPLPCSHPTCFALTYLLNLGNGRPVPMLRLLEPDIYLDIIKNQALMGTDLGTLNQIKDALYSLWSSKGMVPERDRVLKTVKQLMLDLNSLGRGASHKALLDLGVKTIKSIFIHHFMDRYTFDQSRIVKCCNHYPQVDGRLMPACVRNNLQGAFGC